MSPAVEKVIDLLTVKLAAIEPSIQSRRKFERVAEDVQDDELVPPQACLRRFNVQIVSGSDDSAGGQGVMSPGLADRRVQLQVRVTYPKSRTDAQATEVMMASDAELAMRMARAGLGAPTTLTTVTFTVDRSREQKVVLVLAATVQYRDAE